MGNTATSSFDAPSPRPSSSSSLDHLPSSSSSTSLHHRRHSSLLHIQRVAALDSSDADILERRHNPLSPPRKSRLSFRRRPSQLTQKMLGKVLGVKGTPEGIELTETEML